MGKNEQTDLTKSITTHYWQHCANLSLKKLCPLLSSRRQKRNKTKNLECSKSRTVWSFMSKSLNLTGGRMLRVLVWIPGTEAFVSSGMAPLFEVLAGLLVGLTCCTGSLCTSLSGLASGFTCTDGSLAGFRNCLFLLNVVPPDWTTYDLSESFSVQVPCDHVWFLRIEGVRLSLPVQFPALAIAWHVCHGRIWPFVFSAEDSQQNCNLLEDAADLQRSATRYGSAFT